MIHYITGIKTTTALAKSMKGGTAVGGEGKSQSLVALLQQMVDMTDGASSTNV